MQAEFEPAFFQAGPQDAAAWGKLVADVQNLLTRIASLRLLIEGTEDFTPFCRKDPMLMLFAISDCRLTLQQSCYF